MLPQALDWYFPDDAMPSLEHRFPFLDIRVLAYCWSLPPIPMRFAKHVLRVAMRSQLPEMICKRPKEGLAGDPLLAKVKEVRLPVSWGHCAERTPELANYVLVVDLPLNSASEETTPKANGSIHYRPFELASWLHQRRAVPPASTPV